MNDNNQYMVQMGGDFEQSTYIIQDANGLPVQYEGGTIIQGDLSDGNNLLNDSRWIQQGAGRGGKILSGQNFLNGDMVNGTGLNLNTRYTPSSIVVNSSTVGAQFDQDTMRIASAVTGAGGRGRPRGRKPSRGNFPVVPIDMVRQLGIEQQVILQPTVPVAMKNKTTMCKPLLMSKKTQCNENDISGTGLNNARSEPTTKYIHIPVFVPVPVPVYIPVPTFVRSKKQKDETDPTETTLPTASEVLGEIYAEDVSSVPQTMPSIQEYRVIETIELINVPEEPLTIVPSEAESVITATTAVSHEPKQLKRPIVDTEVTVAKQRKIDHSVSEKKDCDSCKLKYSYGINAWRHWSKNHDLLKLSVTEINEHLMDFVQKIRKPNNEVYVPDSILYLCLGIQLYLNEHKYELNLFVDSRMTGFQVELNKILSTFKPKLSENQVLICRIEEEHLWESQQFGSSSPGVLVFTVCYLLTKQMKIKTAVEHSRIKLNQLEVSETQIVFRETAAADKTFLLCQPTDSARSFYAALKVYVDKCTAVSDTATGDHLYLSPLDRGGHDLASGAWYDPLAMDLSQLDMMLNRICIVKEVQESVLSSSL